MQCCLQLAHLFLTSGRMYGLCELVVGPAMILSLTGRSDHQTNQHLAIHVFIVLLGWPCIMARCCVLKQRYCEYVSVVQPVGGTYPELLEPGQVVTHTWDYVLCMCIYTPIYLVYIYNVWIHIYNI